MTEFVDLLKAATKQPSIDRTLPSQSDLFEVSRNLIKPIAVKCRENDFFISETARYLLQNLSHKSGYVRMKSLYLIDYFLYRSVLFREVISKDIKQIAKCSGLIDDRGPDITSGTWKDLESKVKIMIELWDIKFGSCNASVRAMKRYLTESIQTTMPNILENAVLKKKQYIKGEVESYNLLAARCDNFIRSEMHEKCNNVVLMMEEVEQLFEILFPMVIQQSEGKIDAVGRNIEAKISIEFDPNLYVVEDDDNDDVVSNNLVDILAWNDTTTAVASNNNATNKDNIADLDTVAADDADDVAWEEDASGSANSTSHPPKTTGGTAAVSVGNVSAQAAATSLFKNISMLGSMQETLVLDLSTTGPTTHQQHNETIISELRSHYDHLQNTISPWMKKWLTALMNCQTMHDKVSKMLVASEVEVAVSMYAQMSMKTLQDASRYFKELYMKLLNLLNTKLKTFFHD